MTILRFGRVPRALLVGASLVLLSACSSSNADKPTSGDDDDDDSSSADGGRGGSRKDSGGGGDDTASDDDSSPDGDDDDGPDGSITSEAGGGGDPTCKPDQTTQTTFKSLAVTLGTPFNGTGDTPPKSANMSATPTINAPGWKYYKIDGAMCRDGSEFGVFARISASSKKLFIYLEGGGACDEANFCDHNPANIDQVFPGGEASQGQTITGSLSIQDGLQQPYTTGIFSTDTTNPMHDWNGVYVPYCTGDVHFGTVDSVDLPNSFGGKTTQHFVGGKNMEKVMARVGATFKNLDQAVLTGASAGGIGSALNFGMVHDTLGKDLQMDILDDSAPPSDETRLWPACLQTLWRQTWGFGGLPSDCAECNQKDGTGLNKIIDYWHHKYPSARVGLVSTMSDEVIRLFYGQGVNNCANTSANFAVIGGIFQGGAGVPAKDYADNINKVLSDYKCTKRVATYLIGNSSNYSTDNYHQHIFRSAEFNKALTSDGKLTLAQFVTDFVNGKLDNVGP